MFRILQTDPDTAGLQVNGSALLRHKHGKELFGLIDHLFRIGPGDTLSELIDQNESDEKVSMVMLYTSLLHELRHYIDLLLTPYGFFRLRSAFECYIPILWIITDGNIKNVPVPLMSGGSAINQKLLGLKDYRGSFIEQFSNILLSRSNNIAEDNKRLGGDSLLEALAFGAQAEAANALFKQKPYQDRMPYLYTHSLRPKNERDLAFELRYRWHFALPGQMSREPSIETMRLVYWIIFASLCGSIGADAVATQLRMDGTRTTATDPKNLGREVDHLYPSFRLEQLLAYFKEHRSSPTTWEDAYETVSDACESLFSKTLLNEIESDILSDHKMLVRYQGQSFWKSVTGTPEAAFEDLVNCRSALFQLFRSDPVAFIHPAKFIKTLDSFRLPHLIFNFPTGVQKKDFPEPKWQLLFDHGWNFDVKDSEGKTHKVGQVSAYSFLRNHRQDSKNIMESWHSVFSIFSPVYKSLLYGHKYRSMLELDIFKALSLEPFREKVIWDDFYKDADDITSSDDFFEFYQINSIQCDICSQLVTRERCKFISALTIRQNSHFCTSYVSEHSAKQVFYLLGQDWSGSIICDGCQVKYRFSKLAP